MEVEIYVHPRSETFRYPEDAPFEETIKKIIDQYDNLGSVVVCGQFGRDCTWEIKRKDAPEDFSNMTSVHLYKRWN